MRLRLPMQTESVKGIGTATFASATRAPARASSMARPTDTQRYAAHRIEAEKRDGETWEALGKRLGISKATISLVRSGQRNAGSSVIASVAQGLGMRGSEFLAAAEAWAEANPGPVVERVVEPDPRYPNREAAIRAHVELGADAADARRWADAAMVAAESDADLPPRAWFESIEAEKRREHGAKSSGARTATDDDLEPPRATPTRRRKP